MHAKYIRRITKLNPVLKPLRYEERLLKECGITPTEKRKLRRGGQIEVVKLLNGFEYNSDPIIFFFKIKTGKITRLDELHLPMNWLYNFVRRQKLKHFCNVSRHNGL